MCCVNFPQIEVAGDLRSQRPLFLIDSTRSVMNKEHLFILAFLATGMFLSVYKNKLTPGASLAGGLAGYLIYTGTGYAGVILMAAFFVLGVLATGWKQQVKVQEGLAEADKGRRRASQVLANAGVAAGAALLSTVNPQLQLLCTLMVAAAFASATSDTLSSELGNIYGRRFYNIITLKKDRKGENGVVSMEGFLAGVAGSGLLAVLYSAFSGWGYFSWIVLVAGVSGNLFDSFIGALLERKSLISNDMVNFLNTLFAALLAAGASLI